MPWEPKGTKVPSISKNIAFIISMLYLFCENLLWTANLAKKFRTVNFVA